MTPNVPDELRLVYDFAAAEFYFNRERGHLPESSDRFRQREITRWSWSLIRAAWPDIQGFTGVPVLF